VRVTVVVPTYNEAGNIERLCREVRQSVPTASLLIVDDASPDGTAAIAEGLDGELGQIDVMHRSGKAGLGAAYRAGLRAAIDRGAEICIQMDADLSHDPGVLPALISIVVRLGSMFVFPSSNSSMRWDWRTARGIGRMSSPGVSASGLPSRERW